MPVALYNLAPLGFLLLMGAAVALVPALWVRWRTRGDVTLDRPALRLRALTWATLFLTVDLVVFGAFTRLTDSGLGCPDWPGCYGHASPVGASLHIAQAQQALPTGPVTFPKAWIEMIHRYLATGVGALILWLAIAAWRDWRRSPSPLTQRLLVLSGACLVWVLVQGAFGALTVTMKLFPAIVSLHLLGGMAGLALLTWLACWRTVEDGGSKVSPNAFGWQWLGSARESRRFDRKLPWVTFLALWLQIALGAWVSTNYAVLACSDFPRCQGSFWPPMNFSQGFEIWRALGVTAQGQAIVFEALTAIHFTHRAMAIVVLPLLMMLAWQLNKSLSFRPHSRWLAGLTALQLATGLSNVVLGWPLLAALMHTAGAGGLVMVMSWVLCSSSQRGAMQ
jgi:cytochrome c oxidase assembly protein subunit 15